jgi:hypothetical protein
MRYVFAILLLILVFATANWIQYAGEELYVHAYWNQGGNGFGQRFTPPFSPGVITFVGIMASNPLNESPAVFQGFDVSIWSYSAATGLPGYIVGPINPITHQPEWHHYGNSVANNWNYDFIHLNWNTAQDFVVAIRQVGDAPNCDVIWRDSQMPADPYNRNFKYFDTIWSHLDPWPNSGTPGDLILKAEFLHNNAVEPTSLGMVKATFK